VGPAQRWDELVWRGTPDSGQFLVWYLEGGKVAAALSVDRSEDLEHARRLLESGADVSGKKDALADVDSDLSAVASG
jgi:3-phenylpropionate/trans-cinnamate dioxygenase ferredoxin reductase subunit